VQLSEVLFVETSGRVGFRQHGDEICLVSDTWNSPVLYENCNSCIVQSINKVLGTVFYD